MQFILCKDIPNRVEKYQACLYIFPRCSLSYAKISQIERKSIKLACIFSRDADYLMQR